MGIFITIYYISYKRLREGIGIFRRLFPKDKQGFQVLIHWLWFEIFIETDEKINYDINN